MSMYHAGTGTTEYQEEYCGKGGRTRSSPEGAQNTFIACSKSYDVQPVGGRCQANARHAVDGRAAATKGFPVQDTDFVASTFSGADQGHHRVAPQWRDPRWSDETRIANSTLYETGDRDPANRNNFHVYRSTVIDPLSTPATPLAVPDVHKLRYMHNDYMTADDWY